MLVQVLNGGRYFQFTCTHAPNESQLFHLSRDSLRSEFAHEASSPKDWKARWRDHKAWWSWRPVIPQASLYNHHARPRAPCNAAPVGWAVVV